MSELQITFRDVCPEDVDLVFEWANDAATRSASFRSDPIPYADHVAWFSSSLHRDDRHLLLALSAAEPVAFLRFDRDEALEGGVVISINVGPESRGAGMGTATLRAATEEASRLGYSRIIAFIRPSNAASLRAFGRAGYVEVGSAQLQGEAALRYERATLEAENG